MDSVPIIDFSLPSTTLVDDIHDACKHWGFFQIVNHGHPKTLIQDAFANAARFFSLEPGVKRTLTRSEANVWGYYNNELTKNRRDMKEVYDFGHPPYSELEDNDPKNTTPDGLNRWPSESDCPGFRRAMVSYREACESLSRRLLRLFEPCLGLDLGALDSYFEPHHGSFMRLNYYPTTDPLDDSRASFETGHMGVHHHSDAGVFTLLLQDQVGGLQVFRQDSWFDVEPIDEAIVVNIGDVVQVWSNDFYLAPLHRVIASKGEERYSIPYFFNPSYETNYAPLANLTGSAKYKPINWGYFRKQRQLGDYADFGHEIQVSDFRIGL